MNDHKQRFRDSTTTKWFFIYLILGGIGIWKCWFLSGGENWSTQRKTSWSEGEKQPQTLYQHMLSTLGFEPSPHWWEASALTTQHQPCTHNNANY